MTMAIVTAEKHEVNTQNLLDDATLFARFVKFADISDKTVATYKTSLRQLKKYFDENGIIRPERADIETFRDKLIAEKKSPATVKLYISSARVFFSWLSQEGIYANITNRLKCRVKVGTDHKKDALSSAQAGSLIKIAGEKKSQKAGKRHYEYKTAPIKILRDKAVVALMASTGLRCIEISRADVGDLVQSFGKTFLLIQGKGRSEKDAKVLVPNGVVEIIREYLTARGEVKMSEPLFTSTANRCAGKRLSVQSFSKMVKANMRLAGLDSSRWTAHSLRHTTGTVMIMNGVELTKVQQVLRHANLNTTLIYDNSIKRLKNDAEQICWDSICAAVNGGLIGKEPLK